MFDDYVFYVCSLMLFHRYVSTLLCDAVAVRSQHCCISLCFDTELNGAWQLGVCRTDCDELRTL